MEIYSGVVTCFWRHGNIFIYELSVSGTKVTGCCKNRKTFMTKLDVLNFLLLLVGIVFTKVNVYQKLSTLQVIFQWIIIIILTKICFFSVVHLDLTKLVNNLLRSRCTDIFCDFVLSIEKLKSWTHLHLFNPI